MISEYKLKKIQTKVKDLYKKGKSKQSIGKFLNSEFKKFISVSQIKEVENPYVIETQIDITHGYSNYKYKKIKTQIYKDLKENKPLKFTQKFKEINDVLNLDHLNINEFLQNDSFRARFICFTWENIKTKHLEFTAEKLPRLRFQSLESVKDLILQHIYKYQQSLNRFRLIGYRFRLFDYKKVEKIENITQK